MKFLHKISEYTGGNYKFWHLNNSAGFLTPGRQGTRSMKKNYLKITRSDRKSYFSWLVEINQNSRFSKKNSIGYFKKWIPQILRKFQSSTISLKFYQYQENVDFKTIDHFKYKATISFL